MREWALEATLAAREEVGEMISMAVTYLFDNIGKGLPFVPLAVLMKQDRKIDMNVAIPPGATDVREFATPEAVNAAIHALWNSLASEASSLRAGAVLESAGSGIIARGPSGRVPLLRLVGDHRESPPFVATAPWWQERDGQLKCGPLSFAQSPFALFGPRQQGSRLHSAAGRNLAMDYRLASWCPAEPDPGYSPCAEAAQGLIPEDLMKDDSHLQ
jgi:hypothetical protein